MFELRQICGVLYDCQCTRKVNLIEKVLTSLVIKHKAMKSKKTEGRILDKKEVLTGLMTGYKKKFKKARGRILSKREARVNQKIECRTDEDSKMKRLQA